MLSEAQTPLRVGDVIESKKGRRYYVIGFTARGKTRLLRDREGTQMTTWWGSRETLPRGYRWAMWMGSANAV
jgi:hypothetical protein